MKLKISGSEGLKNLWPVVPRTLILEMLTPSNWLDNTEVGNIPLSGSPTNEKVQHFSNLVYKTKQNQLIIFWFIHKYRMKSFSGYLIYCKIKKIRRNESNIKQNSKGFRVSKLRCVQVQIPDE